MTKARFVLFGFGASFVTGVLVGGALFWQVFSHPISQQKKTGAASAIRLPDQQSRPWGSLEAVQFPFADSAALFPDRETRLAKTRWYFENMSQPQLEEFLNSCGLSEKEKATLISESEWQVSSNGFLVSPSDELVRALNPATRGEIYKVLARSPVNYAQRFPFRFVPQTFEAHFTFTDLSPATLDLIHSLTYTNSDALCFADLQLLPKLIHTNELEEVVNALYRVPTYLLRLRISEYSDIDKLLAYWGKGGREPRLRPLLESLKMGAGTNGTSLNISYFMPAFARLRLYTFPKVWPDPQIAQEDCFWTSMNFFNRQPDNKFLNPDVAIETVQSECVAVSGPASFGDLITIIDGAGKGIHMCVYLADDFVFTKNGRNMLSPWVIMKLPDMLSLFPAERRRVVTYRRKDVVSRAESRGSKAEG